MDNNNKERINEKNNSKIKYKKMNNFWEIKKGSICNAYERKNIGSIPSKFDIFIFKLPKESKSNLTTILKPRKFKVDNLSFRKDIFKSDHKYLKNFGSGNSVELNGNSLIFSVNNNIKNLRKNKSDYDLTNLESFKTLYSNNIKNITINKLFNHKEKSKNKKTEKDIDIIHNKNDIFDILKKGIITSNNKAQNKSDLLTNKFYKKDRYNDIYYKSQFLNKYYPGPGQYNIRDNKSINQRYLHRYDSLFKSKSSFSLIEPSNEDEYIGPGSYDNFNKKEVNGGTFSTLKKFNSVNSPFSNREEYTINLGPGSNNLPGGIEVKNKNKMNYFFVKPSEKEENLEKKYGIERIESFGKNNNKNKNKNNSEKLKTQFRHSNKETKIDFNNDWINHNLEKKINEERIKGNIADINGNLSYNKYPNEKQDRFFWARMAFEEMEKGRETAKKRKGAYSFSKIPKLIYESNHVPGPAYYEPDNILNGIKLKKDLNINYNLNWI